MLNSDIVPMEIDTEVNKELTQSGFHIFKNFIFYISDDYDKETKSILFKLISLGYGLVYNKISSFTTHIITQTNKDNFLNNAKFSKFSKPFVVNYFWVTESLTSKKLLNCDDFLPASNLEYAKKNKTENEIVNNTRIESLIFKDQTFTIIKDSYSKEEYQQICDKIISHSGILIKYSNSNESSDKVNTENEKTAKYIIINDGSNFLNDIMVKKDQSQAVVSHRFIDKSIDDRKFCHLEDINYIHLLPLSFRVPLIEFKKVTIHFFGLGKVDQHILEHVVELLGGRCDLSKKTTHIVCNKVTDHQKENFKNKFNPNIIFITTEWIIECLITGAIVREDKFPA